MQIFQYKNCIFLHFYTELFDFIIIYCYLCAKFRIMKEKLTERIAASALLEDNVKMSVGSGKKYRSLAELAQAVGVSAPSLTHALKGNPSLSTIQKIADALGVSVASLFKEKNAVEGYAIIKGNRKVAFTCVEELEEVLKEAKEQKRDKFTFRLT